MISTKVELDKTKRLNESLITKISYIFNERNTKVLFPGFPFLRFFAVVSLLQTAVRQSLQTAVRQSFTDRQLKKCILSAEKPLYNHSGDDSTEDPPVPIPNTEVKLCYAEST